jgi:hypothetical protein
LRRSHAIEGSFETGIALAPAPACRLTQRAIAIAVCGHALVVALGTVELGHWVIPSAAAASKVEEGPRNRIRVRCGVLSDNHGTEVLGKGADAEDVNQDPQRCRPSAPPKTSEAQARPEVPVVEPAPAVSATPRVRQARRTPVQPAAAVPVQAVHVASDWAGDEARRLAQFNPSAAQRLSTALMSGGVLWFLQSSFWASLLLLGLPLWRHVDLLAIVARAPSDDDAQPPADDESLACVLSDEPPAQSNRARPS